MFDGYDEARVPFDHYIEGSLKAKTRAKRATSAASYEVHDEMSITTIIITQGPSIFMKNQKSIL